MLEINIKKFERGTHSGMVTVKRGGKTFRRRQRIGRKEVHSAINLVDETNNLSVIGAEKIKSAAAIAEITDKIRIITGDEIKERFSDKSNMPLAWYDSNNNEYVLNGAVFNDNLEMFDKYMEYSISKGWNKKGYNLVTLLLHEEGHKKAPSDALKMNYIDKQFQDAVRDFYIANGGMEGVKQKVGNYAGANITEVLPEAYALTYSGVDVSEDVKELGRMVKELNT